VDKAPYDAPVGRQNEDEKAMGDNKNSTQVLHLNMQLLSFPMTSNCGNSSKS
jgi:hypothetical protein